MRRGLLTWITVCAAVGVFTACVGTPATPPSTLPEPTPTAAVITPQEAPAAATQPALSETPRPQAESVSLTLWPLDSNLYYLDQAGQVWRQPAAGDQATATIISRPDQAITDFAVAPGDDWLAYRSGGAVITIAPASGNGQVLAPDAGTPVDPVRGRTIAWAPDASKLAYAVDEGFQVYLAGAGEDFTPLIYNVGTLSIVDLLWSPDSEWLLVQQVDGRVLLYQADTALVLQVELGNLNGYTWLADNRLAFAPAEGGLA
ncbi:MAG: hypothetical protein IT326_08205, partial [Anaerolineae bacterium]|nr:hypothetical protein [Anaerolineae bacterium]